MDSNIENTQNPLVFVECMTFNHVNYIEDAMKGFVMQQTDFSYVAVVVDDASMDGEPEVIKRFLEKEFDMASSVQDETEDYVRVVAKHKTNENCTFVVVFLKYNHYSIQKPKWKYYWNWRKKAKYIALCEGDDYWTDSLKLQKQVNFLEEHEEYGFIGANCMVCKGNELTDDIDWFAKDDYLVENGVKEFGNVFESAICGPLTRTCTLLYKKKIIDEFPMKSMGDLSLQAILAHESAFARLEGCSCVYRIHEGGLSNSKSFEIKLMYHKWLVANRKFLSEAFPDKCSFDELEFADRENYIYLRHYLNAFRFNKALHRKRQLVTDEYKNKMFSKYLLGYFSAFVLYVLMKFRHE